MTGAPHEALPAGGPLPGMGPSDGWADAAPGEDWPPGAVSASRQAVGARILALIDRGEALITRRWLLLLLNTAVAVGTALAFLAPVLAAIGWAGPVDLIFWAYQLSCHQMPSRSYFILGEQMAFCQRNTAIALALLAAGLAYGHRRRQVRRLPLWLCGAALLPIALDGTTQLVGLRESTWFLRTITGALAGVSTVWFVYPTLDVVLAARRLGRQVSR